MINIIICDDQENQRRDLKGIIKSYLELKGLTCSFGEFAGGGELLASPQEKAADIIFLDIEMPGIDGMETAKILRRRNNAAVIIFVTAYDDYVFQGYEVRALNYILKPYKPRRIREVLEEALNALSKDSENTYFIETRDGAYKLYLKNVLYFMSDKRKIIAVTKEESRGFYGKLDELQEKLPPYFVRCHRRYLLNIHHVAAVEKDKADLGIHALPVSRSHYQELMIAFAKNMLDQ